MKTLLKLYVEHRKYKRVLVALRMESARLGLLHDNRAARDVRRYVNQLVEYLEEA